MKDQKNHAECVERKDVDRVSVSNESVERVRMLTLQKIEKLKMQSDRERTPESH